MEGENTVVERRPEEAEEKEEDVRGRGEEQLACQHNNKRPS